MIAASLHEIAIPTAPLNPPLRLLLVEDNPTVALAAGRMLQTGMRETSIAVYHAASLADARALFTRISFDMVLLDYLLEDGTGLDFLQELRAMNASVPVVFLTGSDDGLTVARAIDAGDCAYLLKAELCAARLAAVVSGALRRPAGG